MYIYVVWDIKNIVYNKIVLSLGPANILFRYGSRYQTELTTMFDIVLPYTGHLTKICIKTFLYCYKFDKINRWTRENTTNITLWSLYVYLYIPILQMPSAHREKSVLFFLLQFVKLLHIIITFWNFYVLFHLLFHLHEYKEH